MNIFNRLSKYSSSAVQENIICAQFIYTNSIIFVNRSKINSLPSVKWRLKMASLNRNKTQLYITPCDSSIQLSSPSSMETCVLYSQIGVLFTPGTSLQSCQLNHIIYQVSRPVHRVRYMLSPSTPRPGVWGGGRGGG